MGGGMSTMSGVEDILSASYMVGKAIAAITFPGMYRIYDFHHARAPKLRNARPFTMFSQEYDSDEDIQDNPLSTEELADIFFVLVGSDKIYIENPLIENSAGWTPLHTCCMSFLTVPAGLKLIEEITKRNGHLDIKTVIGPGTFNKGWTPLHMATAYGVEPLALALLDSGADPNTFNSYGYTPLLEACHRGFVTIASALIKKGARMDYIPPEELSRSSPFVSTPAQSPLGEAARCGYARIVQDMLDKGGPKNLLNSIGWGPLHEACFYNRIETVKVLLLAGTDSSIRTTSGALPYHLAGLQTIRDMIKDMGSTGSLPRNDRDTIDMMSILQELTYTPEERRAIAAAKEEEEVHLSDQFSFQNRAIKENPTSSRNNSASDTADSKPSTEAFSSPSKESSSRAKEGSEVKKELLHSGPLLGDLPMLQQSNSPSGRKPTTVSPDSRKKRAKDKKAASTKDIPPEFICELCQRQMTDPVKTIYGNVFEKGAIEEWLRKQGRICPLSGAPLSEADLIPLDDLKTKIRKWILQRSIQAEGVESQSTPASETGLSVVAPAKSKVVQSPHNHTASDNADDDLYDF